MKNRIIFDLVAFITCLFLSLFQILVLRKKNEFSRTSYFLLTFALLIVVFYTIAVNIYNPVLLRFFYGCYYTCFDFVLYFFVKYFYKIINSYSKKRHYKVLLRILLLILAADSLSMLLNNFFDHSFILILPEIKQPLNFVRFQYKLPFQFHLFISYFFVLYIYILLFREIINASDYFRNQYIYIVLEFTLIIILNLLYVLFEFNFDISIFLYSIISFQLVYFSIYFIPKIITIEMLSVVSENVNCGIATFDIYGKCIQLNDYGHKIFGKGFKGIENATKYHKYIQNHSFSAKNDIVRTNEIQKFDDEDHYLTFEYQALRDEKGRKLGSYLKISDNTNTILDIQKEHYKTSHDPLTGLYNRAGFFEHCEKIISTSPKTERYMICTNINNFKKINDLFGQSFCDNLLKKQAEALSFAQYDGTVHGRIFADHFAMLISKKNFKPDLAEKNTKRIYEINDKLFYTFEIKIGVYEIINPYENPEKMFDKAYMALQQIQNNKSKMLFFYDDSVTEKILLQKAVIDDLKKALDEKEFKILIQPQIDSKNSSVNGGEALVRWYHPKYGLLNPGSFIQVLETNNKIFSLDYYIWEEAVKILSEWKQNGHEDFYLSVNISPKDFYFNDLYKIFTELVQKYEISPKNLKLEITETVFMHDIEYHKQVLTRLHDYGFTIEMDDFGCGYASLNTLKNLNMNVLKIDMEFLRKSNNEERSKKIIQLVINLAHAFGMTVISEGVETKEQVNFLTENGCDYFQGYYFSKPISVKDFEKKYFIKNKEEKYE